MDKSITENGVVVTRGMPQAPAPQPVQYDDIYTGIYVRPFIPIPAFDGVKILGIVEYVLMILLIISGIIILAAYIKAHGQFRCKNCGKTYCWETDIPDNCTKCGAKLNIPKFQRPR